MGKTPFSSEMTGWLDSPVSIVSKYGVATFNKPKQRTESANFTAEQVLQMTWDGDDNRDDLLSDDSAEHDHGKGSNNEKIADEIRQLLGKNARAQRDSDDSDSRAEQAIVDSEHSERLWLCWSAREGRTACS